LVQTNRITPANAGAEKQGAVTVINEIKQGLYQPEMLLPQNPLRILNSYTIKGKQRNLIIDTLLNK
jgi:hypothetical protein